MTRSNGAVRVLEEAAMRVILRVLRMAGGKRPSAPPADNPRILVCKWCCLGDAILSLYAIREFKRIHPGARIEMLVSSRIADVYRGFPGIEAVHVLPVTGHRLALELASPRLWLGLATLILRLRRGRFGQMVDLELYRPHGALLKRLFGIPWSRGFRVEGAPDKGHDVQVDRPRTLPEWICFYRVLGLEPPPSPPPPLFPRPPTARGSRRIRVGLVFGSSFNWPQKKWPWENYARTMLLLRDEGYEFVLLGMAMESAEARRIAEAAGGGVTDTTGRLDYAGLVGEVSDCDLVAGNDTGTLHLAAACGVPTVTLFGPTDPRKWNPLTSAPVYLEGIPCRPCYYLGSMPPCGHFDCLRKLEPEVVADRIRKRLAGPA
jgi:ADP-heptose:LPS heptosyltransferase